MRKETGRKCKRAIIFENASGVKKGFNLRMGLTQMQIEDYLLSRFLQQYLTSNNLYVGQELPMEPCECSHRCCI